MITPIIDAWHASDVGREQRLQPRPLRVAQPKQLGHRAPLGLTRMVNFTASRRSKRLIGLERSTSVL